MNTFLKVLIIDCATAFYKIHRFKLGDFFGPVDLGLHLAANNNSLNIGAGLLAGSMSGTNENTLSSSLYRSASYTAPSTGSMSLSSNRDETTPVCASIVRMVLEYINILWW